MLTETENILLLLLLLLLIVVAAVVVIVVAVTIVLVVVVAVLVVVLFGKSNKVATSSDFSDKCVCRKECRIPPSLPNLYNCSATANVSFTVLGLP
jgi:hypothetical protein